MNVLDFQRYLASVTKAEHILLSAVLSAHDEIGRPNRKLVEIGVKAAGLAFEIDLSDLSKRLSCPPYYPDVWPGEHYKLLAALVKVLNPRLIVEIGTATGLSALALKKFSSPDCRIITFDIVPWDRYPGHVLKPDDFGAGFQQIVADLTDPAVARQWSHVLGAADFIFVDAAKDGKMEATFLNNFAQIGLRDEVLVMFDDIKMTQMIAIWRAIALPKLDLTSFGHWSGTGLVSWSRSGPWSDGKAFNI